MKYKNFLKIAILVVFAMITHFSYGQILTETFDNDSKFVKSESFYSDGSSDYFGIYDPVGNTDNFGVGSQPSGIPSFTGNTGNFLVGEDLDGDGTAATQTLTWSGLNITAYTGLNFSIKLGATAGFDAASDEITLAVNIDGAGYVDIIKFENPSGFNAFPTNGTTTLGLALQTISGNISGTGSSMDLRLTVTANSGSEEFAVDDIVIDGTLATSDPIIGFDEATSSETETNTSFEVLVPVTVSNYGSDQIDISVAVTGGTAEVADYALNTTSLSFTTDGSQNISIDINPDADDFDDETIILTITETSSVTGLIISQNTHTITVTDDDTAPSIGFDTTTSLETETNVTFSSANIPITVSNYSGTQIDINVSVSGGTAEAGDYTFTSPTALSFTANGTQNITVDVNDDADTDAETIILTITETSSVTGLTISQSTHTISIVDDEAPATYSGIGEFVKITDVSEIVDSGYYVLVDNTDELFAMNNTHNGTFLAQTDVTPVSNTLTNPDVSLVWEIKTDGSGKTIFNNSTAKYISYTGSSNNVQVVDAVSTDNQRWTITYETDEFWISNLAIAARRLQYNSGSPRFACYTGSQRDISIYKLVTSTTWTGNVNTDWATAGNWSSGVPTISSHAFIPDVTNTPIINASTNAIVYNLTISEPDGLIINSGGTLVVNGAASGNVTYNTTLGTENWYLVSSPVSGETYDGAYVTANSLAINGTNNGIATYNTADNTWSYMQTGGGATFTPGKGYSVRRATTAGSGTISFTGTINTSDVTTSVVTSGADGFNLIGNPFTSYLNSASFLTENTANLVSETIWVWNQAAANYETKVTADAFVLAPTQGFFVNASSASILSIAESYQATTGSAFQKTTNTTKPEVKLMINDGTNKRFAKVYYLDNATTGFDNGFDGETFGGIENTVDVFTHLIADGQGKNYQVQSLPNSNHENMVIPIGIIADAGKEIIFTAEALNLPSELKVFLEDKQTNSYTRLDEANANYKVTLTEALNGIGRFFLHTTAKETLTIDAISLENISIYKTTNSNLRVVGLSEGKTTVKLFTILGKQVLNTAFTSNGVQDISLPNVATGVYIVQVQNESGQLNKKITIE